MEEQEEKIQKLSALFNAPANAVKTLLNSKNKDIHTVSLKLWEFVDTNKLHDISSELGKLKIASEKREVEIGIFGFKYI